ncbi:structural maintenance of chromosomes protein 6 isoform X2 [Lutzomyia longipalpis]|uniref:structural maintenance of chromosomes protein 6 isoform X2 n=1 Tax=Lutzomyia longipalpis TaxID=7200 RepID=UPI00248453CD|nr:structural maintenance of chromosomes protein 6 isoform X2 [Lutzomyia longipalpis]
MPKRKAPSASQDAGSAKKPLLNRDKENVQTQNVEAPRGSKRKWQMDTSDDDEDLWSGRILYIHLKNFMCHGNLRVEFNNRCNIIVGNNGSGKSAILTALIIGLGGKASAAHRSSNIKQLVKHGQASCSIEIAIANDGEDAFDTKKYGDRIIITRKISASGASTYKVVNGRGEFLFKDRHMLERLLMYFNIQVDNPICVLHQDAARSFLKECDPKKLFSFYMKATQLQVMIEKLGECLALYRENKTHCQIFLEKIENDTKMVDEMQEKQRALSSVGNKKQVLAQMKKELVWIKYRDLKELYEKTESELQEVQTVVQQLNQALASESSLRTEVQINIQKYREEQNALKSKISEIVAQFNQAQIEIVNEKEAVEAQKKSYEIQRQKRHRIEENIRMVKEHLAQDDFEEKLAQMKRTNEEKMSQLEEKKAEMLAIFSNLERDIDDLWNAVTELEKSHDNYRNKKEYAEAQVMRVSREYRQLDYESKDDLAAYGGYMGNLLKAIEQHYKRGEFSEMPRGPFGRYVEVPDTKWRAIVENILSGYVTAFLVNSHNDHKLLVNIMKRIVPEGRLPSITVTPFEKQLYNYSSGQCKAVRGTYSLMDVIRIQDHNVMNTLINCLQIETILLTEDMDLAMSLTDGSNVPRYLTKVILAKPFQEYAANPFRMYSMPEKPARFIQVNVKEIKENLQRREKILQEELQKVTQTFKKIAADKKQQETIVTAKTAEKRNIKEKLKELEDQMKEIRDTVYPMRKENEALREEHATLRKTLEKALYLERDEKEKYKEMTDKYALLTEKRDNLKKEEAEISKQIKKLTSAEDKENSKVASETQIRRENEAKLAEKQKIAEYLQKEKEKQEKQMNTALQRAEKTGEPIHSKRSEETVAALIKEGQANIAFLEGTHGDLDKVEQHLNHLVTRLEKDKKVADMLQLTLRQLKQAQLKRSQYVVRLKRHYSCLMVHHFGRFLQLRGFMGDISVDYEKGLFTVKVIPRDNHIANATSNTQALSGGERSYTTVSFLLALWTVLKHPFFFLDEYDVFTDALNRQYMTELLIRESGQNPYTQYCFLTPQDMSTLDASPKLTIHKMADPQ